MASADAGEVLLEDLVASCDPRAESSENCDIPAEEDFDDDASHLTTCTVDSASVKDIYGNVESWPGEEEGVEGGYFDDENQLIYENLPLLDANSTSSMGDVAMDAISVPTIPPPPETFTQAPTASGPSIPKGRSMLHDTFGQNKVVFISFDIETGEEYCGILQIAEIGHCPSGLAGGVACEPWAEYGVRDSGLAVAIALERAGVMESKHHDHRWCQGCYPLGILL